jgi:RES domain-containing protein
MYHLIPAGTHLYRVTDIGRNWQDVVSGVGSYFVARGRYNRVQQRTVYAATDPLVSIAENSVHVAIDRWQPRIGGGFLGAQPAFPAPVPPFISEHWLWDFTIDVDMQLVRVETQPARAAFNHCLYELFNPCEAYRTTADLADRIRLHPHPHNPNAMVDGILAPSVRTPSVRRYIPRQEVLFVPANQLTIPATFVRNWRMALEFRDNTVQGATNNTRLIDWSRPWFCLSNNAAALPAFPARPNALAFASGVWHQVRVKYT